MGPELKAEIREGLLRRRDELVAHLRELEAEVRTPDSPTEGEINLAEMGSDRMFFDAAQTLRHRDEVELAEIRAALDRMDAGRYGVCDACGLEIEEERIRALPLTRVCAADAELASQTPPPAMPPPGRMPRPGAPPARPGERRRGPEGRRRRG